MTLDSESKGLKMLKGSRYERVEFTAAESVLCEVGMLSRKGSKERERIWRLERSSIKRQNIRGRWISLVMSWTNSAERTLSFFIVGGVLGKSIFVNLYFIVFET